MVLPSAPSDPVVSDIKASSVVASSSHGGQTITARRFVYGLSTSGMDHIYVNSPNDNPSVKTITGLQSGTQYYIRAQVQNADGWGDLTPWVGFKTYSDPPAPDVPTFSSLTSSSVVVDFTTNGSGGAPILEYQIGYSNSSLGPSSYNSGTPPRTITGLARATTYYFWSRIRTNVGWSPWSPVASIKTLATIPDKPATPTAGTITQTTIQVKSTDPNNGGSAIVERQISRYAPPDGGISLFDSDRDDTLTGLLPATTYNIRYRVRNAIGWSSWSEYLIVKTSAGVWINVNGAWKEAIVWVNDNGTWRKARPWGKILGTWKETT